MNRFFIRNSLPLIAVIWLVSLLVIRSFQDFSCPIEYKISDFPLMAQPDQITCGPASVVMLLMKYNKDRKIEEVKKITKTEFFRWGEQPIGGTMPEYIAEALNHFGVKSCVQGSSLDRLKWYISQDRPCIVLVRSGMYTWHYVVVVGYGENHVEVADPAGGVRYEMKTENFMGAWKFDSDMSGNEMQGEIADLLLFLVGSGETKKQTLIVPDLHTPDSLLEA